MSDSTEYGVPRGGGPERYSWLGADVRATELSSGMIAMGARAYIPQLGRFEQTDPQSGGSVNAYAYTFDDPVNEADPSGEWTTSSSYNDEAAQTGPAPAGLAEEYSGPGAITPQPVPMQILEELAAHPPWDAVRASKSPRVIWESPGCSGMNACAASLFGFKVDIDEITEWWKQAKKGFELIKETVEEPFLQTIRENETVCKAVGYATTTGFYLIPDSELSKQLAFAVGFGTTFGC